MSKYLKYSYMTVSNVYFIYLKIIPNQVNNGSNVGEEQGQYTNNRDVSDHGNAEARSDKVS